MLCSLLLLALLATAQGRAVNISNTWVLPEEGFPVFYRYFRDRISWYEADAVCQFHHANLVTVDTTAQYDAVRAYLKELDISSAVWVGLIRSNPDGDFTWTDYRGLSGDGYWSSAPDARSAPLCAAADPAADYRWEARACGGPTVASFICELPVPQWALGNEGCMVRALPALTVLYLPESAAVQLTADCGLAGVKRVQCTGNVKREDLLRDLSCADEDDSPSTSMSSAVPTWMTTDAEQDTNDVTAEENVTTEHEDDSNSLNSITSTPDLLKHIFETQNKFVTKQTTLNQNNKMLSTKNINLDVVLDNNLQNNDIPKLPTHDNFYTNEQLEKEEDEKNKQHKLLHEELARLGNFENIFSQPTDHFVPPLVMAKAKANDDMTAISFEEKLAQEHTEHRLAKHVDNNNDTQSTNKDLKVTTDVTTPTITTEVPLIDTLNITKDKKEMNKHIIPKKYDHMSADVKSKIQKQPTRLIKSVKLSSTIMSTQTEITKIDSTTTPKGIVYFDPANEDSALDLTVIIKEPESTGDVATVHSIISEPLNGVNMTEKEQNDLLSQPIQNISELFTESSIIQNVTLNDEIIKITFIHDDDHSTANTNVFEITTKMPIFIDNPEHSSHMTSKHVITVTDNVTFDSTTTATNIASTTLKNGVSSNKPAVSDINDPLNVTKAVYNYETAKTNILNTEKPSGLNTEPSNIEVTTNLHVTETKHELDNVNATATMITPHLTAKTTDDVSVKENLDDLERNATDTSEYTDDFQSPLLSGASEPLHKPNRSRRPQQPNKIKKFNPFRILG
ncbi:uncharacterized protein [Epargyreus clarus]|uniref:uncharacterized protein n=1 Tax=Epargyreus clarus TaxID=520877 RepID=UPI003C2F36B6